MPTMYQMHSFGYAKRKGYTVVTLPYRDPRLQLVILLPDTTNNLSSESEVMTYHIRSIAKERLVNKIGVVKPETVSIIVQTLNDILRY